MEKYAYRNKLFELINSIRKKKTYEEVIVKYSTEFQKEDQNQLYLVIDELYNNILINVEFKTFIDICSGPGVYSNYLLDKRKEITGFGISLNPEKGGPEYKIDPSNQSRYEYIYDDINNIDHKNYNKNVYDLAIASCIPYSSDADEYKLIFKSLLVALTRLKKGGSLIINFSFKHIILCINFIHIIKELFYDIELFKSKKIWIAQRTFYIIAHNYDQNEKNINKLMNYYDNFQPFLNVHIKKLLPEVDYKSFNVILKMLELNVFIPLIKAFIDAIAPN
jgi:hypothetical protein